MLDWGFELPHFWCCMLARNIKLVFSTNALMLLSGVITSLLSAWALGPEGRGDLAVVVMWPNVCALLCEFALPQSYRYRMARTPQNVSALFSNTVIYSVGVGIVAVGLAELIVPHLVGERSPAVMRLVHIYLLIIPAIICWELMRGLLEGARRFDQVAIARITYFGIQVSGYVGLYLGGYLTIATATFTIICAVLTSLTFSVIALQRQMRPGWKPSWTEMRKSLHYGLRDYPGVLTEFTTLRLDQLMLGGLASSSAIGLYFVAVPLAEITARLASSVADALMPEVAASSRHEEAMCLLTRSLRLTLYAHLCLLIPLWLATPVILRVVYGEGFLAATETLRLLLIASVLWSLGTIVISGLNGFGHPALSTTARLAAAIVTALSLLYWLPTLGIEGAALSSLLGYTVMLAVALFCLVRRCGISLWEVLRPRWDDWPVRLQPLRGA